MITKLFGQEFHSLQQEPAAFHAFGHQREGVALTIEAPIQIDVMGSGDTLTLTRLILRNHSYIEASLKVEMAPRTDMEDRRARPGDYFVTMAFYDADMKNLLSVSWVTDGAFSLMGSPEGNPRLTRSRLPNGEPGLQGSTTVGIHHAFLYQDDAGVARIKPIRWCSFAAFHLGAG